MSHTHTRLLFHVVFSTKERRAWLGPDIRARLFPYLGAALGREGARPIIVGGASDHVHLVCELRASHALSDIVRGLKANSSAWIKETFGVAGFAWQEGYGAFTVSASNLDAVYAYVRDQEVHHARRSFDEEYRLFLSKHGVSNANDVAEQAGEDRDGGGVSAAPDGA